MTLENFAFDPDWFALLVAFVMSMMALLFMEPKVENWVFRRQFLHINSNSPCYYPLVACLCVVAAPLLFLLPGSPTRDTGGALMLSVGLALFCVEYLRVWKVACRVLFKTEDKL